MANDGPQRFAEKTASEQQGGKSIGNTEPHLQPFRMHKRCAFWSRLIQRFPICCCLRRSLVSPPRSLLPSEPACSRTLRGSGAGSPEKSADRLTTHPAFG